VAPNISSHIYNPRPFTRTYHETDYGSLFLIAEQSTAILQEEEARRRRLEQQEKMRNFLNKTKMNSVQKLKEVTKARKDAQEEKLRKMKEN